jgi:transposase
VRLYKELSEVERAFADLKDVLELRPIYHQIDSRVRAHIYVAALAFLLHRAIEKKLKAARLDLSATEALTALMYLLTIQPFPSRYPAIARVVHLVVISLILQA